MSSKININISFNIVEIEKRTEDAPRGMWVLEAPLGWIGQGLRDRAYFYLIEDSDTEGVLKDSNFKYVCRVKYADVGLDYNDLL